MSSDEFVVFRDFFPYETQTLTSTLQGQIRGSFIYILCMFTCLLQGGINYTVFQSTYCIFSSICLCKITNISVVGLVVLTRLPDKKKCLLYKCLLLL